jgi:hypothetical protein
MPPYQVRGRLIKSGMTEFVPLIAELIKQKEMRWETRGKKIKANAKNTKTASAS